MKQRYINHIQFYLQKISRRVNYILLHFLQKLFWCLGPNLELFAKTKPILQAHKINKSFFSPHLLWEFPLVPGLKPHVLSLPYMPKRSVICMPQPASFITLEIASWHFYSCLTLGHAIISFTGPIR